MGDLKCPNADDRVSRSKNGKSFIWCSAKRCRCEDATGDFGPNYFDEVEIIEPNTICASGSLFGNYYIKLTDDDIQAMKDGKIGAILHEEYNVFIKYVGGEVDG